MPSIAGQGLKIGRHDLGEHTTARTIRREISDDEVSHLRRVLDTYLPGAGGIAELGITCMYSMTPDGIYIVERHPLHAQVVYACGFSGTGYKFSPVIGEILSDLVTGSATTFDTSMFASGRLLTGAHTENPRQGDHVTVSRSFHDEPPSDGCRRCGCYNSLAQEHSTTTRFQDRPTPISRQAK